MKNFKKKITEPALGMKRCKSDPCLFVKHNKQEDMVLMSIIYIDDCIYCGDAEEVKKMKIHVEKHVTITDTGDLDTHLGVHFYLCYGP